MAKGDKTKKVGGTDLSRHHFLWADQTHPRFWLLPICDPTSREKTRALIVSNLHHWERVRRHIPLDQQKSIRAQLDGAAQSYGIHTPEVSISSDEMILMLAERAALRVLSDIDGLYD